MIHEVWWLWNEKKKVLRNVKVSSKKAVKKKEQWGDEVREEFIKKEKEKIEKE